MSTRPSTPEKRINSNKNNVFTLTRTKENNNANTIGKLRKHNSIKSDLSGFDYIKNKKITNKSQNLCPICSQKIEAFDNDKVDDKLKAVTRKCFGENIINSNRLKDEKKKNKALAEANKILNKNARKVVQINQNLCEERDELGDECCLQSLQNLLLNNHLKESNMTINNLTQEKEKMELQMKSLKSENVELKEEIDSQKKNNSVLKWFRLKENLVLKNQLKQKEKDLDCKNLDLKNLESKCSEQQITINNLEKEKNEGMKKVKELET